MIFRFVCKAWMGILVAAACFVFSAGAQAQQPTPGSIATAREIIDLRGSLVMFEPLVPGVVEQAKNVFLQQSPNLQKDLNETAATLRAQLAPRLNEFKDEVAKRYAQRFSEQELKDLLAFFKTPLGKKLLTEEVGFVEQTLNQAQDWGNRLSEEVMSKFRAEMRKKGHNL